MANSKSNIYPIQLQGAELNLNKFDAEIKQYSGFNKNNSPFVGGCLSNVFHKEEQISGGNADNTYIDTNGDVYRVTTEGLFKNGEKLIDYTGKKFYSVVECKTQFPDNTVYVDSEECYLTVDYAYNSDVQYQDIQGHLNIYNPFTDSFDVCNLSMIIRFSVASTNFGYYIRTCRTEDFILTFVGFTRDGYRIDVFKTTDSGTALVNTLRAYNSNIQSFFHLEQLNDEGGILSIFVNSTTYGTGIFYRNYSFDMEGNLTLVNDVNNNGFIASETKLYKVYHNGSTDRYEDVIFDYVLHNGVIVTSNPVAIDYGESRNFSYNNSKSPNIVKRNPFGFILTHRVNVNSGGFFSFGLCDFITPYLSSQNNNYVINTGCVTGEYVLYNNGVVSGICLPEGYVLASEWNTVEEGNIFVQKFKENYNGLYVPSPCEVIYKTKNTWVKLIESTPKLKVAINQVVVNTNHYFNSYDIKQKKVLLYAPAWNNRVPGNYYFPTATSDVLENTKFVASAINEYNLANNCSLLLNPVPVVYDRIPLRNPDTSNVVEDNIYVDFYRTWDSMEGVIYYKSLFIEKLNLSRVGFVFSKLENLPFPTNTDGNVQYSPSLFSKIKFYGTDAFVLEGINAYQLMKSDNQLVMSFFLGTLVENLRDVFIIQGQYYGVIGNYIFAIQFNNGVLVSTQFIVDVSNLQFVGNTPYEALFFSKTNRCLYSFTGANVLNQKQLVDKISEVRNYLYNPATQTVFLITDIGVLFYGLFGMFLLEYTNISNIFLLDNGIVMSDNGGNYRYIKYYLDEGDEGYTKENIRLETCFYGMNNEVVTINDCLYFRLFSEEHEEGDLKVSATTISLSGRKTEETTFKIKASDWDKITHTIYLRYQPKTQRGLGVSFSIDSPFKIASMSVGSQPDAVLVDKVSKGAITAPSVTTNNNEW